MIPERTRIWLTQLQECGAVYQRKKICCEKKKREFVQINICSLFLVGADVENVVVKGFYT